MKIKKITISTVKPTWDIEVKEVHEYLLENGCVSHNSAKILDNNECFEPFTSNIYKRNTLSGEHIITNKYLIEDLINLNLWNDKTRLDIIQNNGSIQNLEYIPENIRNIYKTTWEISQKVIINLAADRGLFIDQSQSMNLHIPLVNSAKLNSALFYAWEKGLKTGMYYMRTTTLSQANKSLGISIPQENVKNEETKSKDSYEDMVCSLDNENCEACGA